MRFNVCSDGSSWHNWKLTFWKEKDHLDHSICYSSHFLHKLFHRGYSICIVTMSMANFMITIYSIVLYPFTSESYPSHVRSTGSAVNSCLMRLFSIVAPFLVLFLYDLSARLPWLMFAIASAVGFVNTLMISYDTLGKDLDSADLLLPKNKSDYYQGIN